METEVKQKPTVRRQLRDIMLDVSWAKVSKRYFDRSPSWIYHKMDGIDGNGKEAGFAPQELARFKGALYDLAERIRKAADDLK